MKFNISNIFKPVAVLALASFFLASCAGVEEDMAGAVGYLCPPALEVDLTVEDLISTRALEGFSVEEPDLADFHYVVRDKDNVVKYDGTGLWEPLTMPVGPYSVVATLGENGFGEPYFYGATLSGASIDAMQQEIPQMTVQVRNAVVRVSVNSDFAKHFTLNSVELTSGGTSRTFTASEIASWYFVPSEQPLEIRLVGQSSAGVSKEFVHTITPEKRSATDIICNQLSTNVPVIDFDDQSAGAWATRLYVTPATFENISAANQAALVYEIIPAGGDWASAQTAEQISGSYYYFKDLINGATYTVRARIGNLTAEQTVTVKENLEGISVSSVHYKDGNGNLAGTNSTLSVSIPDGILKTLNTAGLLQITGYSLSNGSETVRTAVSDGLMAQSSNWPYLPQGANYVLTINHKLSTESVTVESINTGFSSPSPEDFLTIDLTSYSSYDKYLENNPDAANGMDAFTIKTLGATWTVSPDLMNNTNYSKSFTYNNNGQSVSTYSGNTCSLGDKGSLAVGTQYKVSASVTFDGETVDTGAPKTHYITGLPYRQDPLVEGDWTGEMNHSGKVDWKYAADCVNIRPNPSLVRNGYARITSNQEFFLPASVNVNVVNDGKKVGRLDVKYFLRLGSTTLIDGNKYGNNTSIGYNASTVIAGGTHKVQVEATYGAANTSSSYNITKIEVLYGPLPQ